MIGVLVCLALKGSGPKEAVMGFAMIGTKSYTMGYLQCLSMRLAKHSGDMHVLQRICDLFFESIDCYESW